MSSIKKLKTSYQSFFRNLAGVKIASLYFDEVIVSDDQIQVRNTWDTAPEDDEPVPDCVVGARSGGYDFTINSLPEIVRAEMRMLINEGIVRVKKPDLERRHMGILQEFVYEAKSLLQDEKNNYDLYQDEIDMVFSNVSNVWTSCRGGRLYLKEEFGMAVGLQTCLGLYTCLKEGTTFCTDSKAIFQIFSEFLQSLTILKQPEFEEKQQYKDYLAFKIMEIVVPKIKYACIDDILEVRFKLRNELAMFRNEINQLSWEIQKDMDPADLQQTVDKIVDTKINPALFELKQKLNSVNSRTFLRVFDCLKDPRSYVPLVGGIFSGIPPKLAAAGSLAIAATEIMAKSRAEKKEIKRQNTMTYLFDVQRLLD